MSRDDDDEDDITEQETFTDKIMCPNRKCGHTNQIEGVSGPGHGGWEEEITLKCEKCGSDLEAVKAFSARVVSEDPTRS